jgi:hypothetical protein
MRFRLTFEHLASVFPNMKLTTQAFFLAAVASVACGKAAGPHYNSPYATLHGAITSASVATPPSVRVALVWQVQAQGKTYLKSAQELGVETQFPVEFQLDVTQLPPPEAMSPQGPSFRFALGTLVVYEDLNGNGQLDLLPLDATSSPDLVLGVPGSYAILYVEGDFPNIPSLVQGGSIQPGFNLLYLPLPVITPWDGGSPCAYSYDGGEFCGPFVPDAGQSCIAYPPTSGTWTASAYPDGGLVNPLQGVCSEGSPFMALDVVPTTTLIPIELTASPALGTFICEGVESSAPLSCPDPGCVLDLSPPPGATVTCAADGQSYRWFQCASGICAGAGCRLGDTVKPGGATTVTGWPCP